MENEKKSLTEKLTRFGLQAFAIVALAVVGVHVLDHLLATAAAKGPLMLPPKL